MQVTPNGQGYRFVASDGGIFAFGSNPGSAPFYGSMGGKPLDRAHYRHGRLLRPQAERQRSGGRTDRGADVIDHRSSRTQKEARRLYSPSGVPVTIVIVIGCLFSLGARHPARIERHRGRMTTTSASLNTADASAQTAAVASPNIQPIPITQTWEQILSDTGGPIAQSSPTLATVDSGGSSIVVGDRAGRVYAFHLADERAGWLERPGLGERAIGPFSTVGGGHGRWTRQHLRRLRQRL